MFLSHFTLHWYCSPFTCVQVRLRKKELKKLDLAEAAAGRVRKKWLKAKDTKLHYQTLELLVGEMDRQVRVEREREKERERE